VMGAALIVLSVMTDEDALRCMRYLTGQRSGGTNARPAMSGPLIAPLAVVAFLAPPVRQ
jgi:hypothetical protein